VRAVLEINLEQHGRWLAGLEPGVHAFAERIELPVVDAWPKRGQRLSGFDLAAAAVVVAGELAEATGGRPEAEETSASRRASKRRRM